MIAPDHPDRRKPPPQSPDAPSPARRWPVALLKLALFAVVAWFVTRAMIGGFRRLDWRRTELEILPVAGAVLLEAARLCLGSVVLGLYLRDAGHSPPARIVAGTLWMSRAGKYVPGKVASIAGAVWLLTDRGVPAPTAAGAVFRFQGTMIVMGLIVAAPLLAWGPFAQRIPLAWVWFATLAAGGFLLLHPRVLGYLGARLPGRLRSVAPPAGRPVIYVGALVLVGVGQVLGGLALWLVIAGVHPVDPYVLGVCTSLVALSGTAGFVAVFAPGGLGVREGILLSALTGLIAAGPAAVVVVVSRAAQMLAEAVMALIGVAIFRATPKTGGDHG